MSLISSRLAAAPKVRVAPAARRNDHELVVELSAAYGAELDPWQVDVLKAGCGVRPGGLWAAKTVCCNVSRQNGKSWILTARALAGALLFGEKVIICPAHEQKTSRLLFMGLESYFESFDDLRKRVKSVGRALGREEIWLRDGTHLVFMTRTRTTLRGRSIDCYLADEAQLVTDPQWESVKPAMSARPNSTAWLFGTAPQVMTDAEVFGRLRRTRMRVPMTRWRGWSTGRTPAPISTTATSGRPPTLAGWSLTPSRPSVANCHPQGSAGNA